MVPTISFQILSSPPRHPINSIPSFSLFLQNRQVQKNYLTKMFKSNDNMPTHSQTYTHTCMHAYIYTNLKTKADTSKIIFKFPSKANVLHLKTK